MVGTSNQSDPENPIDTMWGPPVVLMFKPIECEASPVNPNVHQVLCVSYQGALTLWQWPIYRYFTDEKNCDFP